VTSSHRWLRRHPLAGLGVSALLALPGAAPPRARAAEAPPEPTVVEEILALLAERGILDEADRDRLVARYSAQEAERRSALPRLSLTGDLRVRFEGFSYDEDELGDDQDDRFRGRYRLRVGASAEVAEWAAVHFRLASGEDDLRSTNTSFGRADEDFDPDAIFIDQAFVQLAAPGSWVPLEDGRAQLHVGKTPNPFVWKATRDLMTWDNDIMPEGVALLLDASPRERLTTFLRSGYFVLDENTVGKDPHLFGLQLGAELAAAPTVAVGGRASWYAFDSLDSSFFQRGIDGTGGSTSAGGNLPGGLGDGDVDVGELGFYLRWSRCERWPLTVFAHVSANFSAESVPGTSEEERAWGAGVEVGDKTQLVALGAGYWAIEANAFPAQFIDSDLFDGVTNRRGFSLWGTREIWKNTELNLEVFWSEPIEEDAAIFGESVEDAERIRFRSDLVFKF
jgi:hypothetical protein